MKWRYHKNIEDYATCARRVEKRLILACSETEINKEDIVNITDFDTAVEVLTAMNLVKRRKWFRQAHNHILMQQLNKKVDSVMQHIYNASKTEFDSKGYRERGEEFAQESSEYHSQFWLD